MIHRFARILGFTTGIICTIGAPAAVRAQAFEAPAGYSVRPVFGTNAGIAGFDVADDGSILMILGSGGYGTPASRLVRFDPISDTTTTLYTFADAPNGNFVEAAGGTVYFGQSGSYFPADTTSETNRIMSFELGGAGLTTNLILQNYAAAHDALGRLFFTGNPDPGFSSNAVYLVSGGTTNRVVDMPLWSGGLTFATNGDLVVAQALPSGNHLFRFTRAQVSNAVATATTLLPADGAQIATNIAGSSCLAADSDSDFFYPDFGGSLHLFNAASNAASVFGAVTGGFAVVSALQFQPGLGSFEPSSYSAGTLYALLTDFGSFNQVIAIEVPNTAASWRAFHFTEAELAPELETNVWGFAADPDADGLPNGLEYALGRDPRDGVTAGATPAIEGGRLTIGFTRDPLNRDMDYVVEVSASLEPGGWQEIARSAAGGPMASSGIGAGSIVETLEGVRVRVQVGDTEPASASRRFIRLRVEVLNP